MERPVRQIGRTDVQVTALGLGAATLGGVAAVSPDQAAEIVDVAYTAGIRYFDTAPQYGYGKSEHILGDVLRGRPDAVISTKVGRLLKPLRQPRPAGDVWHDPFPFTPVYDYSYDGILRSYEDSLQRLGASRVHVVFIHDPDVYVQETGRSHDDMLRAIDSAYRALHDLRASGEIQAIGIGVNAVQPIADALPRGTWDGFLLAGRYTLLEQETGDTILPAIADHGASVVVGGPFNSGILAGGPTWNYARAPEEVQRRVAGLKAACSRSGVSLRCAALQFPLRHPAVSSVIPGPRSAAEMRELLDDLRVSIAEATWRDLQALGMSARA